MTFAEELPRWCDEFCREQAANGNPVMISEFTRTLTLLLAWALHCAPPDTRELLRFAIHAALEPDNEPSIDKRGMH